MKRVLTIIMAGILLATLPLAAQPSPPVFTAVEHAQARFFGVKLDSSDASKVAASREALAKAVETMELALRPTRVVLTNGPTVRRIKQRLAVLERQARDLRVLTQAFSMRGASADTSLLGRIYLRAPSALSDSARTTLSRRFLREGVESIPSPDQITREITRVVDEAVRKALKKYLNSPPSTSQQK